MSATNNKQVTFIQYEIPPLKAGEYTITATQTIPTFADSYSVSRQFAVAGERFSLDPSEIKGVFPPDLANGEYDGVLPQVIFNRRTLPWNRTSVQSDDTAPWLTVLLLPATATVQPVKRTAKDLVPLGQKITVAGSDVTGSGTLPANTFSYPEIAPLDYGESPDDPCLTIDLALGTFNQIVPSAAELRYLAHIREVDTTNSVDNTETTVKVAVVMGNRLPQDNVANRALLVSLENFGDYLPDENGTPCKNMPATVTTVRLLVYRSWTFTPNTLGETFQSLLEKLNTPAPGFPPLSSLQVPVAGTPPTVSQVAVALNHQANGALSDADAMILVQNAATMGYLPLNQHLRHAGRTVSWYRGPLVPYPVADTLAIPITCPDAANGYNPQTGLFDLSYGAAWQLGQLLALQNSGYATALYQWKRTVKQNEAVAAEHTLILQQLHLAETLQYSATQFNANRTRADAPPVPPDVVVQWIARLRLLYGVPFNYLVADERLLPPESLRFFRLDNNWMTALVDGAFSIGRMGSDAVRLDRRLAPTLQATSLAAIRSVRPNPKPVTLYANSQNQVSGFLLRSMVVSGWPRLGVNGYADTEGNTEIPLLRMSRLGEEILLCLFDGVVAMVAIHEPPEQLHAGVEENQPGQFTTTLRAVTGDNPGKQYLSDPKGGLAAALIPTRSDGQTLIITQGVSNIRNKLTNDFGQVLTRFTAAEFALEMVKGVVKVEFSTAAGGNTHE